MQNFSSLAFKLREEFEVTNGRTEVQHALHVKIYLSENSDFSTQSLSSLEENNTFNIFGHLSLLPQF